MRADEPDSPTAPSGPPAAALRVYPEAASAALDVAREIAAAIRARAAAGRTIALGLATGATPIPLYDALIRMRREEGLSFRNVFAFNLDEYYPIAPDDPRGYRRYMQERLLARVDIPAENAFIPPGDLAPGDIPAACAAYERAIAQRGGIDIQILGIGRNGHIGFNEPGSAPDTRTRLVELDATTRGDAAEAFGGLENAPRQAISMGVGTILEARRIILMAWGPAKARSLREATTGAPRASVPASFLRSHPNALFVADEAAAQPEERAAG